MRVLNESARARNSHPALASDISLQEYASGYWESAGYACYQGGHIAQVRKVFGQPIVTVDMTSCYSSSHVVSQVILTSAFIFAFVTMAVLFNFLVFDSNPLSVSVAAKAHGRADLVFLACKARTIQYACIRRTAGYTSRVNACRSLSLC
jgi:hypothetical protein